MASDEKLRYSGENPRDAVLPKWEKQEPQKPTLHSSVYIITWISLSASIIIFNKRILDDMKFDYPIILTTWHLVFASLVTQVMARTTTLLDGRKSVKMTTALYARAIVPIGIFFSLSLICGNLTYLYLSVAFIQMLKATTPVAVLLASWSMGFSRPDSGQFLNVSIIVIGVVLATFGEIKFVAMGFLFQCGGIVFEAIRLVLVQKLLKESDHKMDPLVSLYYFAPLCACMNGVVALYFEVPRLQISDVDIGISIFLCNAIVAFLLNVSVVFLIGKTSSLVLTLCGVLKDVILIAASMIIWESTISRLQLFGYSIALGGLVYYNIGGDELKSKLAAGYRLWLRYGTQHPLTRKAFAVSLFVGVMFLVAYETELKFDVHHSLSDKDFDSWVGSFVDPYHFR